MIKITLQAKQGWGKTALAIDLKQMLLQKWDLKDKDILINEEGNMPMRSKSKFPKVYIVTMPTEPCMCGLYQGCKICGHYQKVRKQIKKETIK